MRGYPDHVSRGGRTHPKGGWYHSMGLSLGLFEKENMGLRDGSVDSSACIQARGLESEPRSHVVAGGNQPSKIVF